MASLHSDFVSNAWYAAASSSEVADRPLPCTLLAQRIVLYRSQSGRLAALRDRCAHRFAPLSMGDIQGETIVCPYHGMAYDGTGRCQRVPGQNGAPAGAVVQSFPVLERFGLVFVWMGKAELADPAALVDIDQYAAVAAGGWGLSRGYSLFKANWLNIADNLVDPAHTSFVHQRTIGNTAAEDVAVSASESQGVVTCGRWIEGAAPVPIVKRFVERFSRPGCLVDRWQFYHLKAPATSWVDFGAMDAGLAHTPQEQAAAPYRVLSYAFLTPRDASSTHYFSFQLRNFATRDAAVTAEFEQLYKATFDEDRVLLEAIQREEDRHPGLRPVRIASDAGVARLRRLIGTLQQKESEAAEK